MLKAPKQIKPKDNNPCLFTVVRQMKFTGLFDASKGYIGRECGTEVADRRVLV